MAYTINAGSADLVNTQGGAVTNAGIAINAGTAKMAGNVSSTGPLDNLNVVNVYNQQYGGGEDIGGIGNSVGAVAWQTLSTSGAVGDSGGVLAGKASVTQNAHGRVLEDVVQLAEGGTGIYDGVYRVTNVVNANEYGINGAFTTAVGAAVTISGPEATSSTDATVKTIGTLTAGQYSARGVSTPLGFSDIAALASPGSEQSRDAVHSRKSVQSHNTEAVIRDGGWNEVSGVFTTAPVTTNDFTTMRADLDGEVLAHNSQGVGGEYSYRMGVTTTTGNYPL